MVYRLHILRRLLLGTTGQAQEVGGSGQRVLARVVVDDTVWYQQGPQKKQTAVCTLEALGTHESSSSGRHSLPQTKKTYRVPASFLKVGASSWDTALAALLCMVADSGLALEVEVGTTFAADEAPNPSFLSL